MPVMISNEIKRLKDISLTLRYSSTAVSIFDKFDFIYWINS